MRGSRAGLVCHLFGFAQKNVPGLQAAGQDITPALIWQTMPALAPPFLKFLLLPHPCRVQLLFVDATIVPQTYMLQTAPWSIFFLLQVLTNCSPPPYRPAVIQWLKRSQSCANGLVGCFVSFLFFWSQSQGHQYPMKAGWRRGHGLREQVSGFRNP